MEPNYETPKKLNGKKLLIGFTLVVVAVFVWMYLSTPLVASVAGVGSISASASNATISFSIASSDPSAVSAIANVNAKALAMTEFLKTKGVTASDIAQGQITVVPSALITQGTTGYQASITMAAKTTLVSTISFLISELYTNGAYVVSQPILSVENKNELERAAFDLAVKDAKSQSDKIAVSNRKFFKKIAAITQAASGGTSTATTKPDSTEVPATQIAIDNGVFKITKTVTVTYKMW